MAWIETSECPQVLPLETAPLGVQADVVPVRVPPHRGEPGLPGGVVGRHGGGDGALDELAVKGMQLGDGGDPGPLPDRERVLVARRDDVGDFRHGAPPLSETAPTLRILLPACFPRRRERATPA